MNTEGLEELWTVADGLRVLHYDSDTSCRCSIRYLQFRNVRVKMDQKKGKLDSLQSWYLTYVTQSL